MVTRENPDYVQPQALSNRNVYSLIVEVWGCQYLNSKLWAGSTEAGIDSWKHWLKFILLLETLATTKKPASESEWLYKMFKIWSW